MLCFKPSCLRDYVQHRAKGNGFAYILMITYLNDGLEKYVMSGYVRTIWNNTLDLLKEELTEISFNTWIKTIEPISIQGNVLKLEVPAEFNKGILESRYSTLVKTPFSISQKGITG